MTTAPIVKTHDGVLVVRDDLFHGGTKARFLGHLFIGAEEVVYASPAEGGAQTALAHTARRLGKQATIFVAKRAQPHPRALEAHAVGAKVVMVKPGYLSVVKKRAADYCEKTGALLAPFGVNLPEAIEAIADAARSTGITPDEVWCAAGSGTLTRALQCAWPDARFHCVQVGRTLTSTDRGRALVHVEQLGFSEPCQKTPPFPSDPHYDAKAWWHCVRKRGPGKVLFWNVTGPANPALYRSAR